MNLETFVAETLQQIVNGVARAQEATRDRGARVNPKIYSYNQPHGVLDDQTDTLLQNVNFDVALTTSEGSGKGGGISVGAAAFGVGARLGGESSRTASEVSRVQFVVPIVLPPFSPTE